MVAYPEKGFITEEMLKRQLPWPEQRSCEYFVCGPEPMMNIVENALLNRGIHLHHIHAERFDIGAAAEIGQRQKRIRNLAIGLGLAMAGVVAIFALLRQYPI